ncbi:hypothetical protein A6E01_17550 [Vibrio breoganii]|uniref:Polysaccharide deacetylase n=1 Tax=Vibrio breoganii TaxID=553239 RepID=A0AAN0XYH6_9VIBR|nr:hypothetical protein [Vibrio breoganii]ANO34980.1 hypothetical protein A6E01_17550 [Vibrio breoganii]
MSAKFIISIDFEKKWGLNDLNTKFYDENIRSVPQVINETIKLFKEYDIRATWGVVGALILEKSDLEDLIRDKKNLPSYSDLSLDIKECIHRTGYETALYNGLEEIKILSNLDTQSICSHTFWHSYYSEDGINSNYAKLEYELFDNWLANKGIKWSNGMIFPRNQIEENIINSVSIDYYRSNKDNIFDKGYSNEELNIFIKSLRFLDAYIKLRKNSSSKPTRKNGKISLPASRFLRVSVRNRFLNRMHLIRIKNEMLWAAKHNDHYHLWWHPHNFGGNNSAYKLEMLEEILIYYKELSDKYGMKSQNMHDIYLGEL